MAACCARPHSAAAPGQPVGQRRARASRTGRREPGWPASGWSAVAGEKRLRVGLQALRGGRAQRLELAVVHHAERADEPRPDLRLGQRARQRLHQRMAQLEGVVRELEIEERRLGLLELAGGGQHVVGQARGLGHRHVDDDQQLQRLERLAEALPSPRASARGCCSRRSSPGSGRGGRSGSPPAPRCRAPDRR